MMDFSEIAEGKILNISSFNQWATLTSGFHRF